MSTNIRLNIFLNAIKTKQLKSWFYIFRNGHPFLLKEEVDIITEIRLNDKLNTWMNDSQIQELIKIKVEAMYKIKFPNAKKWTLPNN